MLKISSVTFTGLTLVQANALAIAAENGELANFLNDELCRVELSEECIADLPSVQFGEGSTYVEHTVDFDS